MHSVATEETTENSVPETLPFSLPLELTVNDPEVIAELWAKQEGHERDEYALGALRLGVLALRQARGQIDANTLKREGDHLLGSVQLALSEHRTNLDRTLVGTLKDYFDPKDGRFNERVERLLKKDGELETLLSRKVTAADSEMCRALKDIATAVGNSTGLIKNCKKGDAVVELGSESAAPGAKVVVEAKEHASYNLTTALKEMEEARQNREAESGLFVFSKKTAPAGLEPLARYGTDVVVVWDADDVATDTHLRLGLSVARALCTRKALERSSLDVDFTAIDAALLEIAKQVKELDDVRTWTETISLPRAARLSIY